MEIRLNWRETAQEEMAWISCVQLHLSYTENSTMNAQTFSAIYLLLNFLKNRYEILLDCRRLPLASKVFWRRIIEVYKPSDSVRSIMASACTWVHHYLFHYRLEVQYAYLIIWNRQEPKNEFMNPHVPQQLLIHFIRLPIFETQLL